jgi:uncharacterized protein (TIGR03083 family)
VQKTLEFPELLQLIDERSTAFRAAIASAPDLEVKVPTCPEWTLLDLAAHLGAVHRRWVAIVSAGPTDGAPVGETAEEGAKAAPQERAALLAWSAESTRQLLDALREAGPDRGCWVWWDTSQSPHTSGAVARHQVQEATVHTYDAQITGGAAQPLPDEAALDGVEEFLSTCVATTTAWPHEPADLDLHATEGRSWRLSLSADGARFTQLPTSGADTVPAAASVSGTASELVLVLYDRKPIDALQIGGDRRVVEQLRDWDPDA